MALCFCHVDYFYLFTLYIWVGGFMTGPHFKEIIQSVQLTTHCTQLEMAEKLLISTNTLRRYQRNGVPVAKAPIVMSRIKECLFNA